VPISVSVDDTLDPNPTHICCREPKQLLLQFMEELDRRGAQIRRAVRADYLPDDLGTLPKKQRTKIEEWCDQVPVWGFNCGRYDLNLIKEHFAELLADTTTRIKVAKKANSTMFILTPGFRFLDIINYLGPGISYDKWTKAYE